MTRFEVQHTYQRTDVYYVEAETPAEAVRMACNGGAERSDFVLGDDLAVCVGEVDANGEFIGVPTDLTPEQITALSHPAQA